MTTVREVADAAADRLDSLAEALSELSGLLLDEESVQTTLQRIADLAVRTIPGCVGAGVTLLAADSWSTAVHTGLAVVEVDQSQYSAGDGPCLTALRDKVVVCVGVQEAAQRWPAFAGAAREAGITSFLAAPLLAKGTAIGSLNLYSDQDEGFDALDEKLVALFVGQASVALANARVYHGTRLLTEQLSEAMSSRAVIEQAKGALMAQEGCDADTAFALLRHRSQLSNRKLRDIAQEVVDSLAARRPPTL